MSQDADKGKGSELGVARGVEAGAEIGMWQRGVVGRILSLIFIVDLVVTVVDEVKEKRKMKREKRKKKREELKKTAKEES